jgi:hypothetical protein
MRIKRGKNRITIPHSKGAQYTFSISCLYYFARSCCPVSDNFATQIPLYFTFISPLTLSKECLLEFAHSSRRLAADQTVVYMSRGIDVLFIFSIFWSHPN